MRQALAWCRPETCARIAATAASYILILLVLPITVHAQPGGPAPVKVAPLAQKRVAAGQSFVGTITPVRRSVVGSAVAGRIVEFPHNEGDYVEKGDKLAQVLTGTIEIELDQAKAELKVREAELAESVKAFPAEQQQADARLAATRARREHAQGKLKRTEVLRQRNSASEEAYDEAQSAYLEANGAYLEAEAARHMIFEGAREQKIHRLEAHVAAQKEAIHFIEDRIEKYTIKAYFSGYVTAEFTEVGHWIKDGEPVVEIAEMDEVDVRVNVSEEYVDALRVGNLVRVEVSATGRKSFLGRVWSIVPQADLKTRTFPVLVRLTNPRQTAESVNRNTTPRTENGPVVNHELKAGMLARAILPVGDEKEALLVSKDAIVLGGASPTLIVVEPDKSQPGRGTVRAAPVILGAAVGNDVQVQSADKSAPLAAGALVVVEGNERLRPGQPVTFAAPPAEPAAARNSGP